jgi:translocator protein
MDDRPTDAVEPFADALAARRPPGLLALAGLLLLLIGLGAMMGMLFMPGDWYDRLAKPSWNPPNWVFGPLWTILYALMATALWLVLRDRSADPELRQNAIWLFVIQYVLNLCWTPLFFGLRSPLLGLIEVSALALMVIATIRSFAKVRMAAALLLLPYLLWVGFAWSINAAIWWLNR